MAIVGILRSLLRHRLALACGLLPAVLTGIFVAYHVSLNPFGPNAPKRDIVSASGRVLLEGDEAPPIDLETNVSDPLGPRSLLLADLMATDRVRRDIAVRAGLARDALTIISPAMRSVELPVPLAVEAMATAVGGSHTLTISGDGNVPILTLRARTPDPAAGDIVDAAIASLNDLLASGVPDAATGSGLRIQRLGPTLSTVAREGSRPAMGVVVALVVMGLWAGAIVLLSGALRRRPPPSGRAAGLGDLSEA